MPKNQQPVNQRLRAPPLVTMALDPGLAELGIAALQWTADQPRLINAAIVKTKKATKKELQTTRIATDDMRRVRELWNTVGAWLGEHRPVAVAIEGYSPIPGQQGHGSWKVGAVAYALVSLCWSRGIRPIIARPADLRRHFLQRQSGTKLDIEQAVSEFVTGAGDALASVAASKREHVADAIGYAVLAYQEMERIRAMAGLSR